MWKSPIWSRINLWSLVFFPHIVALAYSGLDGLSQSRCHLYCLTRSASSSSINAVLPRVSGISTVISPHGKTKCAFAEAPPGFRWSSTSQPSDARLPQKRTSDNTKDHPLVVAIVAFRLPACATALRRSRYTLILLQLGCGFNLKSHRPATRQTRRRSCLF